MRTLDTLIVSPQRAGRKRATTISPKRQAAKKHKEFTEALKLLEAQEEYAIVQTEMRDEMSEAEKNISDEARHLGTSARLDHVLNSFDIRARSFLKLVTDIALQNAYISWVRMCADIAWLEYTGYPIEVMQPVNIGEGSEIWKIAKKNQHWVSEGYRHLASLRTGTDRPSIPAVEESINQRRTFVDPLLLKRGWSVLDWANEAEVSHATAIDYLDGKTKPYRSTLSKLAKALGVPIEQLPK